MPLSLLIETRKNPRRFVLQAKGDVKLPRSSASFNMNLPCILANFYDNLPCIKAIIGAGEKNETRFNAGAC